MQISNIWMFGVTIWRRKFKQIIWGTNIKSFVFDVIETYRSILRDTESVLLTTYHFYRWIIEYNDKEHNTLISYLHAGRFMNECNPGILWYSLSKIFLLILNLTCPFYNPRIGPDICNFTFRIRNTDPIMQYIQRLLLMI